jgi:hypothetical protein
LLADDLLGQIALSFAQMHAAAEFPSGVTCKFAQIFFCDDKDLRGKQRKDPKNPYRTGIFGVCHILKYFAASAA